MKALISGAKGQLGQALLRSAPEGTILMPLPRERLDISDAGAVDCIIASEKPDLIINAAAYTAVDRAEREADLAFAINRDGPANLARAANRIGARLVHVSTDFVFDGTASCPYAPDHPPSPLGVYGRSKADGETAVQREMPQALILRSSWIYAAQGQNFMRTMLRLMATQPLVRVVADQVGTPTHAKGLAHAIWGLVGAGAKGLYHWSDAGVASWYDFAVAIREEALALGLLDHAAPILPIRTLDYPTPAHRPAFSVLDKSATWALLGQPAPHWRDGLRDALSELRSI